VAAVHVSYRCRCVRAAVARRVLSLETHPSPRAELFRSASPPSLLSSFLPSFLRPSQPHYVRLRFNARNLRLPACAPEGKHLPGSNGEVCTFEAFKDAVRDVEVSSAEWRGLCGNKVE
jgi:acid phosphatase